MLSFENAVNVAPVLRILDFNGLLVWAGPAKSGIGTWYGNDLAGNIQQPGIYIYQVNDGALTVASGSLVLAR